MWGLWMRVSVRVIVAVEFQASLLAATSTAKILQRAHAQLATKVLTQPTITVAPPAQRAQARLAGEDGGLRDDKWRAHA